MKQSIEEILQKCKSALGKMMSGLKNLFSQDFSVEDLRRLPHLLKWYWQQIIDRDAMSADDKSTQLQIKKIWDAKLHLHSVQHWILTQRKLIFSAVLLITVLCAYQLLINPYLKLLQEKLFIRPAQWAQLEYLVMLSKTNGELSNSGGFAFNRLPPPSFIDETEMQRIQLVFVSRGIKLGVFRLGSDNLPQIELQANEVIFSVLLDALEELRLNWRLYPIRMNIVATPSPGVVSISGALRQYGVQ